MNPTQQQQPPAAPSQPTPQPQPQIQQGPHPLAGMTPQAGHLQQPNPFDRSIPGQSLTDTPKNSPWEHPPMFTKMDDALHFIFDQLLKPANYKQLMMFLDKGMTVEHIVRMILFTGFSTGHWTPDLGLMLVKPTSSIVAGIAARAGMGHVKMGYTDRSGFKHLYNMSKAPQVSSSNPNPPAETKSALKGLMAPKG